MQSAVMAFDSRQFSLILEKMLGSLGFETIHVENIEQLRLLLQDNTQSVLLTDWFWNGQDMLDFLSGLVTNIKVIFISNEYNVEKIEKAIQNGVDEYIMKPFDNDILQSKLAMIGLV